MRTTVGNASGRGEFVQNPAGFEGRAVAISEPRRAGGTGPGQMP